MPPDFRESRMSMQSGYPFSNTSHSEMPPANMTMSPALMSINRNHISPNETYHDHDPNRLPSLHYQPQVANDGRQSQSIVNSSESFQQPFVNHAQSQSNLPTPFMPAPIQHSSNYPAPTQDSYFPPQPQFHQQSISQTPSPVKSFAESHSHSHIPNVGSLPVQDSSSMGHTYPADQAPEAPQVDEDTIRKVFEQCNALNEADKKLIYDFVTGVNRGTFHI
ncbi:hypothetical protein BKA69DRAFT_34921 [Paraphysoderma sedebokerense]|nr:hypothetical protein BKA69DRAFT_34921 [Paraphysoderma sedebokerense]